MNDQKSLKVRRRLSHQLFSVAVTLLVTSAALLPSASAAATPAGEASKLADTHWYANVAGSNAAGTSKALDIKDKSSADGAVAQLWKYDVTGATLQQQFYHLEIPNSNRIKLQAAHSGKCLDTKGPSDRDGTQVHQWTCYDTDSQKWVKTYKGIRTINGVDRKVYTFQNQFGRKTCLDNANGSGNNGNKIQIWSCNGTDNQLWF